ncbi:MAG TPA: 30S ribosomal protein S8 [Candidatus Paceibacterota bacterium]
MDPIADMLTSIRNAGVVHKELAFVPYSKLKFEIANILLKEGYIKSFSVKGKKARKHLELEIAYIPSGEPRVEGVKRVSKQGRRVYAGAKDLRPVMQGRGMLVISTPKGLMTGLGARKAGMGGEVLFSIY